jgi:hypothetical protein
MITPPTSCFYLIRAEGEAAEAVSAALSVGVITDIRSAVLISGDFESDMQATVSLDSTIAVLKNQLPQHDLLQSEAHNPLYVPSSGTAIDEVLDGGGFGTEGFRFVGMDGSPFTLKTVSVSAADQRVIEGKVSCRPFELPSYTEIIMAQEAERLQ